MKRAGWALAIEGVFLSFLICLSQAHADVLDIAPDGAVSRYSGPAVYSDEGARSIFAQASASTPAGIVSALLATASQRYAVDPGLLSAVAWKESHYRHDVVSAKGAIGVMQLMPETARALGVDPHDISQNVMGGAAYLRQMLDRYRGNRTLALAAYNAGPNMVDRFGSVPPFAETKDYVRSILGGSTPSIQPVVSPVLLLNR